MPKIELSLDKLVCLSVGILLAGLPHWPRLPFWIPAIHLLLIAGRLYLPYKQKKFWQTQRSLIGLARILIMIVGVIGVYTTYGTLTGRDVGITLLVLLSSLKILESQTQRDFYVCAYLGYFLVITNFFYEQTIPTVIYMFVITTIMTACLIGFNDINKRFNPIQLIKLSSTLLVQSVPLLLIMFILFPRVNGPLWGLPEDALTAVTGIDDQMSPGSISKLVQSSEVAFRVSFAGDIPEQSNLYWRGPVLWQTDGRKWTHGTSQNRLNSKSVVFSGDSTRYELMLEPTNKKWIFALELLNDAPADAYLTQDYQLKTGKAIQARKAYQLESYTSYQLNELSEDALVRALALPETSHIKSRDFADQLRQQYQTPEEIIQAILNWFQQNAFIYTLKPPLLTGDSIDEFLFNTRQGFCEHYAAAFTVLMRSSGIPARVVTGYLGGEINPVGDFLVVRQYHAHAWAEVWLKNKGWVRIDPTAVISPERVDQGIENAIPEAVIDVPFVLKNNSTLSSLWQRVRRSLDTLNYQWSQWVLGYGPERQQQLLNMLGLKAVDWKSLTILLFIMLGGSILLLGLFLLVKQPKASDPAKRYYNKFCSKLAKKGFIRQAHEGPIDYANRVINSQQHLAGDVEMITRLYVAIRYRSEADKLAELKQAVNTFVFSRSHSN